MFWVEILPGAGLAPKSLAWKAINGSLLALLSNDLRFSQTCLSLDYFDYGIVKESEEYESMFNYYEMLHASSGKREDSIKLSAYRVQGYDRASIEISKAAIGPLLDHAQKTFDGLEESEKAAHIDPNEANPVELLNQQVKFLVDIAPDFLKKTSSPYIVDLIPDDKKHKSQRLMGFENAEGLYTQVESESPQKGFLSILKMAFRKDFINFTNAAREELKKETSSPELYAKKSEALNNKAHQSSGPAFPG